MDVTKPLATKKSHYNLSYSEDKEALIQLLTPESQLEKGLFESDEFLEGLTWGKPRKGHPEGQIYKHILEVNANIDQLELSTEVRQLLRFISFVHDTFKFQEDCSVPRDWSKHHAVYARKFAENFTRDEKVLNIIELHDEAYYIWKGVNFKKPPHLIKAKLQNLQSKLGHDIQLFYLFFKCDTHTGNKILAPIEWFESTIPGIQKVRF